MKLESFVNSFSSHPLLAIVAVIFVMMIVVTIVKSLFKLASFLVMIGLALVLFFDFSPKEVIEKGTQLADTGSQLIEGNLFQVLLKGVQGEDFFIKKVGEDTVVEIESLGISYNVSDVFDQLSNPEQERDLQKIIENSTAN
jgi:hypothetical protein